MLFAAALVITSAVVDFSALNFTSSAQSTIIATNANHYIDGGVIPAEEAIGILDTSSIPQLTIPSPVKNVGSLPLSTSGVPINERWGYLQLTEDEQDLYSYIYLQISNFAEQYTDVESAETIALSIDLEPCNITTDTLSKVQRLLHNECPEFYWLDGGYRFWYYSNQATQIDLYVTESFIDGDVRLAYDKEIENELEEYEAVTEGLTSAYDVGLVVLNKMCDERKYSYTDGGNANPMDYAHCMVGIMADSIGEGVCESYAEAYQYIMYYLGYDAIKVVGYGNGGAHAWNMLKLDDGNYYWVDATWCDLTTTNNTNISWRVNYNYFVAIDSTFLLEHTVDMSISYITLDVPAISTTYYDASGATVNQLGTGNTSDGETYTVIYDDGKTRKASINGLSLSKEKLNISQTVQINNYDYTVTSIEQLGYSAAYDIDDLYIPDTIVYIDSTVAGYLNPNVVIHGNAGSIAETFASDYSFAFVPTASDISDLSITLSSTSFTYSGAAITPAVTVMDGTTTLSEGIDYTTAYQDNINAGEAKVTITGIGDYSGEVTKTFTINRRNLSSFTATLSATSLTYNGVAKTPTASVKNGTLRLTAGTDYSLSYSNNINSGTATVTINGIGNYKGSITKTFTINKRDLSSFTAALSATSLTYNGTAKIPTASVKYGSLRLTAGTDYSLSYSNNINSGTATVTINGIGNYKGTITKTFTIKRRNLSAFTATLSATSLTYNGAAKTPTASVKYGSLRLTAGTDYTLSYSNNVNSGTATVTINGIGNYTGKITKTFTINRRNLNAFTATLSATSLTYNGVAKTPTASVKRGSLKLIAGTDYTLSYTNNVDSGTAIVTITGIGNYTGTLTKTFTINRRNINAFTATLSETSVQYDGTEKTPCVTVKRGSQTLVEGEDYTVNYTHNIDTGTATVTITGIINYSGTITKTFTIYA